MKSEKFRDVVEAALMYAMGVEFKIWRKKNSKIKAMLVLEQSHAYRTALYPDLTSYKTWDSVDEIEGDIKMYLGSQNVSTKAEEVLETLDGIMEQGYDLKVV